MATYYWVGGSGTWDNSNTSNWSASSGGAGGAGPPLAADTVVFDSNSGTGTCTTAATAAASIATLNSSTLGLTLGAAFTMSGAFTLTLGALDLGGFQLTCLSFASNNSNTRSIAFGATGSVKTTVQGFTAWDVRDLTGFTATGSKQLIVQPSTTITGTTVFHRGTGASEAKAISIQVIASSGVIALGNTSIFKNIDLSSFTPTSAIANTGLIIYGNLILSSGITFTSGTFIWTFAATSGTNTIETTGVTFTMPVTFNGAGGTWQLIDNLTIDSSRALTLTAGTLDLNGKTVSAGSFASAGSTTRVLAFGTNGTITITGSGATAWSASGSNLTTTGASATISMTSASAKTFAGGGFNYAATLNQGGSGALTISGSNTFSNITNTVQPVTFTFTAGTTQTVSSFTASGTSGNLVTLQSSSAGSRFTLSDSSGTNSVNYCSIKDSLATGGAVWNAYVADGNVDGGNNNGWQFAAPVTYGYSADIKLRSLAQRGRF